MNQLNYLVTSIGAKVALTRLFRNVIEKFGGQLIGIDCDPLAPAGEFCHKFISCPTLEDPHFQEKIKKICEENRVALIIPTREEELIFWKSWKNFSIPVACSGIDCLEICRDKIKADAWLRVNNFPSAPHVLVKDAIKNNPFKKFPLIAKGRTGSGSRQLRWIYNEQELLSVPSDWLLQPKLEGEEYTINLYVDKQHHCRCAIPHRRIQVVDGEVNRGITVKDPELMQLGKSIAEKLPESYGPLNVQVFYDANDHSIYVTDINPRFGGGYPLAHAAGGTFTDWLILEALGKPLDIPKDNWIPNLLMRRYRENIFTVL